MGVAKLPVRLAKYLEDIRGNSAERIAERIRDGQAYQNKLQARIKYIRDNGGDPSELTKKYNEATDRLKAYRYAYDNPQAVSVDVPSSKSQAPKPNVSKAEILRQRIEALPDTSPHKPKMLQELKDMAEQDKHKVKASSAPAGEMDQKRLLRQVHEAEQRLEDLTEHAKYYMDNELEIPAGTVHLLRKTEETLKKLRSKLDNPSYKPPPKGGVNETEVTPHPSKRPPPNKLKAVAPAAAAPMLVEDEQALDEIMMRYGAPGQESTYQPYSAPPLTHEKGYAQTFSPEQAFEGAGAAAEYAMRAAPGEYAEIAGMLANQLPGADLYADATGKTLEERMQPIVESTNRYWLQDAKPPETPYQKFIAGIVSLLQP